MQTFRIGSYVGVILCNVRERQFVLFKHPVSLLTIVKSFQEQARVIR